MLQCLHQVFQKIACGIGFPPLNATAKAEAIKAVDQSVAALRELAPDMGAYMNEVSLAIRHYQQKL